MRRDRNESEWNLSHYDTIVEFLSDPRTGGGHSIEVAGREVDLFVEDRLSPTTLVVFNSALPDNFVSVPVFTGRTLAKKAGVNFIGVSDPSISMGDINLAWYLGNRDMGPLRPLLSPLINHILVSLGTKRTILFGASGGGYAVANFAHDFPGCLAIAVNPRLHMGRRPIPDIPNYLKVCHRATNATPMRRLRAQYVVEEISTLASEGLNHHFLLYQNVEDLTFLNNQAKPFLEAVGDAHNVHVRFNADMPGHSPIPSEVVQQILAVLASPGDDKENIRAANFLSVRDSLALLGSVVS